MESGDLGRPEKLDREEVWGHLMAVRGTTGRKKQQEQHRECDIGSIIQGDFGTMCFIHITVYISRGLNRAVPGLMEVNSETVSDNKHRDVIILPCYHGDLLSSTLS